MAVRAIAAMCVVLSIGHAWGQAPDEWEFPKPDASKVQPKLKEAPKKGAPATKSAPASEELLKPKVEEAGYKWTDSGKDPDYLAVVKQFCDTMVEHGRDGYGEVKSPLFAAALDRTTLKLPAGGVPRLPGIRGGDRTTTGANPMHDQNMYQVMYALTKITGDKKYEREADAALKWCFENTQSKATGLMAWGEHMGWDFSKETHVGRDTHEFYRPWVFFGRCWEMASDAARRFADGLRDNQVNMQTGDFSRHANYTKPGVQSAHEFPRHAGFYIAVWAEAYARTKDASYLKAIGVVIENQQKRFDKKTGILQAATAYRDLFWPASTLSLSIDLHDAAGKVPAEEAAKFKAYAEELDQGFLGLKHELEPGGRGFQVEAKASTGETFSNRKGYTDAYRTGYGTLNDAGVARLCIVRYEQVKNEKFKELFLKCAKRYATDEPQVGHLLLPGGAADIMGVLRIAYEMTGEKIYLDRARLYARFAVEAFFEEKPLPRASLGAEHYEAISRSDTLVQELLELWAAVQTPRVNTGMVYTDR